MQNYLQHLECSNCKETFSHQVTHNVCHTCGKPLLARYALEQLAETWKPNQLKSRPNTMWRYSELLPICDPANIVSLGETVTPLIHAKKLGAQFGLPELWIKDESRLPTGSFKARGLTMAVSKAQELKIKNLAIPSAGNAATALSVYAARAGIPAYIFMPDDTPIFNIKTCQLAGANLTLIDGLITDAGRIVAEQKMDKGWFDVSTLKEPYRVEGKKTMGFELAEQLGWTLPDVIVYPTGGGTGIVGMWKGFAELEAIGWISKKRPRFISVQAEGCAPIVKAWKKGLSSAEPWQNAKTIASGLRVPQAIGDFLILEAIRKSDGAAIAVTDEAIGDAMHLLPTTEGILTCPEGAATVAALEKLIADNVITASDQIVLFNTGGYQS
ncbi:threonine synthase [Candidatus Poribacteria bacterium]|nr:threonine synthase [Candidatus Poribacteria bacterium]MYF54246.1 threonine synthase [Candidatus Poribacteria bacterium]MYI93439.1 threonine synthase [Candidatus Poribacteria bacterium]